MGWSVDLFTYAVGDQAVCVVSNVSPGATIARASGRTVDEAESAAISEARSKLAGPKASGDRAQESGHESRVGRVVFQAETGTTEYTLDSYCGQTVDVRIRQLMSGQVAFYDDDDNVIPVGDALELMARCCANVRVV